MREGCRSTCAEVAPPVGQRLKSAFLLLVMASSLLPGCSTSRAELDRSMDDALLLALAAHEQLELGQPTVAKGGQGLFMALRPVAAARPRNPHWELAGWYEDMAMQRDTERGPMFDYAVQKIEEHNRLASELDKARQQRAGRGRGLQRFTRGFVRGLVQVPVKVTRGMGQMLKGTLRVTGTVIALAIEQAPQIARDYVMQKLRELQNLAQGRIELGWDKIAGKLGVPFAMWLRKRVDPAFMRWRNRMINHLRRQEQKAAQPGTGPEAGGVPSSQDRPAYGDWDVDLLTDNETCGAGFSWSNYWVNLPAQDLTRDDCQPALDSTHHVDFLFEPGMTLPLRFDLDSGQLMGGFDVRSFENLVEWETVEGSLSAEIEDGWVRPRADNQGWDFGGVLVVDVQGVVGLECVFFPDDPMSPPYSYWLNDDKRTTARTEFRGSTFQLVAGSGDEPGRVMPGGAISLTAGTPYEGGQPSEPMLFIWCEDQSLPADFPAPVSTVP